MDQDNLIVALNLRKISSYFPYRCHHRFTNRWHVVPKGDKAMHGGLDPDTETLVFLWQSPEWRGMPKKIESPHIMQINPIHWRVNKEVWS